MVNGFDFAHRVDHHIQHRSPCDFGRDYHIVLHNDHRSEFLVCRDLIWKNGIVNCCYTYRNHVKATGIVVDAWQGNRCCWLLSPSKTQMTEAVNEIDSDNRPSCLDNEMIHRHIVVGSWNGHTLPVIAR